MSEAANAGTTETVEATANTSLTGDAPASAGEQQQSPEGGQEKDAAASGQGTAEEEAATGGTETSEDAPSEGGEGGEAQGAPEQYADFTLPEDFDFSADNLAAVQAVAKELNLNQDQAQKLVDLGVSLDKAMVKEFTQEAMKSPVPLAPTWAAAWSQQTMQDADIGGANLDATMALTRRVFATFGTPELGTFLNNTGLAHHPELVRFMHKVGKAVSEDTLVAPSGGTTKALPGRDPASKLYPDMAKAS